MPSDRLIGLADLTVTIERAIAAVPTLRIYGSRVPRMFQNLKVMWP